MFTFTVYKTIKKVEKIDCEIMALKLSEKQRFLNAECLKMSIGKKFQI